MRNKILVTPSRKCVNVVCKSELMCYAYTTSYSHSRCGLGIVKEASLTLLETQ